MSNSSPQTAPATALAQLITEHNLRPASRWRTVLATNIPNRPTTVPAAFRAAARLIATNGHHRGDYLPDPFDRVLSTPHASRPLSIVAAIRCAATGDPHRASELSEAAIKVMAGRLLVDGEPPWNDEEFWLELHVANWGDAPGRTTESAVAVLEAAGDASEVAA